jgi:hypothetical protein
LHSNNYFSFFGFLRIVNYFCACFISFFDFSLRGENIVNSFLQLLLLCGRGGVVTAVTADDLSDFAQRGGGGGAW